MKRAKHNLSHYRIMAGEFGLLYPFSVTEILPGDTFRCSGSALVRIQPLMTPLMHPVEVAISYFFVPNRIVWSDWEAFITGRTALSVPVVENRTADTALDYMGVVPVDSPRMVNALPLRAFNKIWNEFYRDQDLQNERAESDNTIPHVAWKKDYFSTARPYAQSGNQLGEAAVIVATQDIPITAQNNLTGSGYNAPAQTQAPTGTSPNFKFDNVRIQAGEFTGSVDINEWRRAMAIQRFREHRNKFGSRYKDLLAYLGVPSPDGRLDRPEYLGGGRQTIAFSEVLQMVESTETPLGSQAGHGIASIRTRTFKRFFQEHGYLVSVMHIRPTAVYMEATDRTFIRTEKDDFWQKENEMLGEQPVVNAEIHRGHYSQSETFGYAPRHDDYRSQRSLVTGPMRKEAYATWHMARNLAPSAALNDDFIKCQPTKRVFRSSTDPQFFAMVQNRIAARRLVSKYARN